MQTTEDTMPVTFQMRLPREVLDRMRNESSADMIPMNLLARRCIVREYGGVTVLPSESTERTESVETVHNPAEQINDD